MAFKKNSLAVAEKPIETRIDLGRKEASSATESAARPITSLSLIFYRMVWCFAGPALLALSLARIATTNDGWVASTDIGFVVILAGTVAARWLGFMSGERANTVGEITTKEQLHRYTLVWLVGGSMAWIVANVIGGRIPS
ncbi:hypothetical protein [Schlesneria paludicola]|uniref:hypothetical protein n=1 Tax=Schlesneria paludicola TaxID=360056 RepID=UPI00029A9F6B|nr:hypothetical protein [Schlesneria paludicola]